MYLYPFVFCSIYCGDIDLIYNGAGAEKIYIFKMTKIIKTKSSKNRTNVD